MREQLDQVTDIARRAGEILLKHYRQVTADRKADQSLVTIADREAERFIRGELARAFPDDTIIGEEFGRSLGEPGRRQWFVDPLDGTTNYVHRIPCWCVAIGLLEDGIPKLGVIHQPLLRETCRGAEGVGAWVDDRPLAPWAGKQPFGPTDPVMVPTELLCGGLDFGAPVRIRALGSAQLHFALVAAGSARAGLWHQDYGWDLIAGAAICREAGVRVTKLDGAEPDWSQLSAGRPQPWMLCAAPPGTHERLLEVVRPWSDAR